MANLDHAPEITDEREYGVHFANYRAFLHVLWSAVGAIAIVLIFLAAWAG